MVVGGGGHGGGGGVGGGDAVVVLFCTFTCYSEGEAFDWSVCLKCWSAVDLPRHSA